MRADPGIPLRIDPAAVYGLSFMRGSRLDFLLSLLGFLHGTVSEPEAVVSCFEDVAVMSEAVEKRGCHLGVTKHLVMPQCLTGESLKCGWLIRTILFMASAFRSAVAARDGDRG